MAFKEEFKQALESGKKNESLWGVIRRHQTEFTDSRQCYDVLQEIWLDYGFDSSPEESELRNELEFAMEKAWYGGLCEVQETRGSR